MIKGLYYILVIFTIIYGLYFFITTLIGLFKKSKVHFLHASKEEHMAILIPARNEEKVIKPLIESLKSQNYRNYDIYVIPNNCTDNTEKIAKSLGCKILKCQIAPKTKGDVLKYAFKKLENNKKIAAYVIFDADNVVHPNFLKEMNNCLASGYKVAQGNREAKNPTDNWLSSSYTLFYLFQNVFFNQTRMTFKSSCSINGTGFMIAKSLIDEKGFPTYTLTEDMEYTGICALNNEPIVYVSNAITYDEYPTSFKASWKQRKRWSAGIISCFKLYFIKLLKCFKEKRNFASLDMALVYLGPIMQVVSFLEVIIFLSFKFAQINEIIIWFLISYLIGVLIIFFILKLKKKKPKSVFLGIWLFCFFILTWVPINIICLVKKQTKWEEIKHDKLINIHDVMK